MSRLLKSVIISLASFQGITLAAQERPRLVVGIIVDQLRTDYLETLQDKFGDGGFRRLMEKGIFFKDIDFKVPDADAAVSTAIIQTGCYPRQNGIPSASIYDPSEKKSVSVFYDPAYIGNFTTETYSPAALRVTTLSDEIALEGNGSSVIHSIAPEPEQAIILAGHAGNSAFWFDDETGKWSSTTYYTSPPAVLQNKNYNSPLVTRLDTMKWIPSRPISSYPDVSSSRLREGFRYTFPRSDRDVFRLYRQSPYINAEITETATDYIKSLNLGKKPESTDVLNLGYTLASYPGINKGDGRYELEDSYLRLDSDLEKLFREIDRTVGMENVVVYLSSTGFFTEPERDLQQFRLPTGIFSVRRALSLLNSYLAAKYGNGAYVGQYSDGHIYLDRQSIEEHNLDLIKVSEDARDFLVRMSGVSDAYTVSDLQSPAVAQLEGHRLANDPKTAGDIILEFNPGWKVSDDTHYPAQEKKERTSAYPTPAFILGGNLPPQTIKHSVDAAVLAPTVARTLRIRSPNGAVEKPISF